MYNHIRNNALIIFFITLAGLISSSVFHYIISFNNNVYPHNTFLFDPAHKYSDFTVVFMESSGLNPYLGNNSAQYPLLNLVGYIISLVADKNNYQVVYFVYVILCVCFFIYNVSLLCKSSNRLLISSVIGLILLTSYPFLFAVDRGNFELLVFVVVASSLTLYKLGSFYKSALFLACAASMKLFPLFFLIIFIKDKKYKELFFSIGCFVVINICTIFLFKGGIYKNLHYLFTGGNITNNSYFNAFTSGYPLFQKSVSLYNFLKIMLAKLNMLYLYESVDVYFLYKIFVAIIILILSVFIIYLVKDLYSAVLITTIVIILLPYISADYKMLYIFLPILIFIFNYNGKFQIAYSILFGLALVPKSYYLLALRSDSGYYDITISSIVNPILLVILLFLVIYESSRQQDAVCQEEGLVK